MVNELLELSSADKEALNLINLQYIYPKEIILDTIKNYQLINEKIVFTKEINEDINLKIKEEHLKQLLMIIIDNAIKYNDKEKININIKLDLNEKGKYLSIKDNGIGIDKTHIPKLTDRFYKVDESRQKNNSFGLGLSIANKILSLYNYNLNIASETNHYTKITIEFNE
ncbi:Signal transduction histidine-protein kinase ArlS [bioreactor metagenome]|uniref:histidine kinase n=1 Tax=bioreactor metagenome TaxID=1076179 RepID=A0A645DKL2_9ZZZZ